MLEGAKQIFRTKSSRSSEELSISVVIPLYNHAAYIEGTIESVRSQTSAADEIILIDDGSSDGGFDIAARKLREVLNARFFKQKNAGAHVTLNKAIGYARSRYVAVLNSDDLFVPTKLERCRDIFRSNPDTGLLCGKIGIIDGENVPQVSGVTIDWLDRASVFARSVNSPQLSLLNENYVGTTSNMVFRRDLWEAASGFQNLRYCHDLDFLMYAFNYSRVFIDQDVQHIDYRVHERNTIKEDLTRIRIEIGAVLANTIFTAGPRLFSMDQHDRDVSAFGEFLTNKGLDRLLCYFLAISKMFPSRSDFYAHATDTKLRPALETLM